VNYGRQAWILWLCAVWLGLFALADHEFQPGASALAPARWPAASKLPFAKRHPLLLLFLHTRCPCSQACLSELQRLRVRSPRSFDLLVVVGLPGQLDASDITKRLERLWGIPRSEVFLDPGLQETSRFGSYTSGQSLLYSSSGRLRYQGGLTGSRGHEGENSNAAALLALLSEEGPGLTARPVYGCGLRQEEFCSQP